MRHPVVLEPVFEYLNGEMNVNLKGDFLIIGRAS